MKSERGTLFSCKASALETKEPIFVSILTASLFNTQWPLLESIVFLNLAISSSERSFNYFLYKNSS